MPKRRSLTTLNRKLHHWGAIIIGVHLVIVLISGVPLILKKELTWIQPPTIRGEQKGLALEFDQILAIARALPEPESRPGPMWTGSTCVPARECSILRRKRSLPVPLG